MLSSIRSQICGGEAVSFGEISQEQMKALYAYSKAQDMAHVVATELDRQKMLDVDEDIGNKFRKQQFIALMRYERINYELEEVCRLFEERGIPHLPLKGAIIRRYYKEPWMRTSADIDMLVKEEDIDRAREALKEALEYREGEQGTHYDYSFFALSGVHLELHYRTMASDRAVNSHSVLERMWENSVLEDGWNYRYVNSDEMFYFYHIAHMVKHFENKGCGVRFFLDLWILCHGKEYDREKRNELLEQGQMSKFAEAAELLADVWFSGGEHTALTRAMEAYLLNGGIYGSRENMIVTSQIKKGGKFGYFMSKLFLNYDKMTLYYPSIKGKKWLLPAYNIRRWFRIVFCGGLVRSINDLKRSSQICENKVDDVENLLRQLGI